MENWNIQLCWSACDLRWVWPPYPTTTVYKRHLGGVATLQYIMPSNLWAWSWGARVGGVLDVHKEGVLVHRYLKTNVDKLIKIYILYIINEFVNYTMKFRVIKTSVLSSSELYSQKIYQSLYHGSFNRINVGACRTRIHHSYWVCHQWLVRAVHTHDRLYLSHYSLPPDQCRTCCAVWS
jgi:hypothetical protein